MFGLGRKAAVEPAKAAPVLDLSGPRLRRALDHLVESAEPTGGVDRYVTALWLKSSLFQEILTDGKAAEMTETEFLDLCAFVTPARRRISALIQEVGFEDIRARFVRLLDGSADTSGADARKDAFSDGFTLDRAHRWLPDLAAEVLHFTQPERYPLMTRWIWDAKAGSGVLRELWFADDVSEARIDAPSSFATYATLCQELDGFLRGEGIYRDLPFFTDLLMAHVYAAYINDRGGEFMRAEFATAADPMLHTRRMLGLDAVDTETGRTRLKLVDGTAHTLGALGIEDLQETT
ncbi:hypothetical protein VK792_16000 [Mesobacterium sp. TK19101]|uniref:Uncharacterized protein n=1 Tax=Mesobacterium hydrothermale TaxID=3111907 RepID=A0ABU6HKC8_9RHOB|nr:hypothetical protein [Mesobacterium sp. TK19101]MEC3862796.1 hypothetical protein [Mesobacterium sp. TK19101]